MIMLSCRSQASCPPTEHLHRPRRASSNNNNNQVWCRVG